MSDKMSRAVAAGEMIEVDGKEYTIRPISMKHLKEIQSVAFKYYKRQLLQTYSENADLLGEQANDLLMKKMEEVSRWDVSDLPNRFVYDVSILEKDLPKLEKWIKQKFGDLPNKASVKLSMISSALDSEELKPEELKKLVGKIPPRLKVPYDAWWVTATYEGIVTLVWAGLGGLDGEVTKKEVQSWSLDKLYEAASVAEKLTAPMAGNM